MVAYDPYVATNLGLSALPTAAPAAAGGLPTVDASNGVTVGTIATDAVSAAALKADAVDEIVADILVTPANKLATDASGQVTVGTIAANVITAASINAAAITAAKFAASAIDANALAADAVDEIVADILATPANKLATDASGQVTVGALAANVITAAAINAAAITAAKFGAGAINAAALATDAAEEIADKVWEEPVADHKGVAGSFAKMFLWLGQRFIGKRVVTKATGSESVKDTDESTELYTVVTTDDNGTVTQDPSGSF